MAIYDNDLDPFGDGSLIESYIFEDSLENEQGTRTFDALYENEGDQYEGCTFVDGAIGKARETGSLLNSTNVLNGQMDCSVSFWANIDVDGNYLTVYVGDTYYAAGLSVGLNRVNDTELGIRTDLSYDTGFDATVTVDINQEWFFVVLTYNVVTGDVILYLDGVNIASSNETGASFDSENWTYLHGTPTCCIIDQFMVWNKELSQSEINELITMEKGSYFIDFLVVSENKVIDTVDFEVLSSVANLSFIDFSISSITQFPEFTDLDIVSVTHEGVLIDFDILSTCTKDPEFINLNIISENIPSDTESPANYSAQLIRRTL